MRTIGWRPMTAHFKSVIFTASPPPWPIRQNVATAQRHLWLAHEKVGFCWKSAPFHHGTLGATRQPVNDRARGLITPAAQAISALGRGKAAAEIPACNPAAGSSRRCLSPPESMVLTH